MIEPPDACTLTPEEARAQSARHAALGASATGVAWEGDAVRIDFDETVDRSVLDAMIAVERRCCPFFALDYDEAARSLRIAVAEPFHRPALEHVAERLGAGTPA